MEAGAPDGGAAADAAPSPRALQLVSFTPDVDPIPVAPTAMKRPIAFTAVVKLATREDGSGQSIALATLSRGGAVLAQLAPKAPNVFQGELPDRTVLLDATLRTKGSDDPRLGLTLTFIDDRSEKITFERSVGIECAVGPATNHSYFCSGICLGLRSTPYEAPNSNCGGCGLACSYTPPGGTSTYGGCTMYSRAENGGWVESCGTFVQVYDQMGKTDLSRSCDQVCATYAGRGKPGVCAGHCSVTSNGLAGAYSEAGGASYGGVEGIIGARFTNTPDRGIPIDCNVIPSAHIAGLPDSGRPAGVRGFGCCCSFD